MVVGRHCRGRRHRCLHLIFDHHLDLLDLLLLVLLLVLLVCLRVLLLVLLLVLRVLLLHSVWVDARQHTSRVT